MWREFSGSGHQDSLLLAIAIGLMSFAAASQPIFVPNGSETNSLALGNGELAHSFVPPPGVPGGGPLLPTTPGISASFAGTTNNGYAPPDTMGAVGTNRLMIMINGEVRIQDRAGGLISTTSLNNWWSGAGSYSDNNNQFVYDPHVIYDPYNDRWIAVAAANPANLTVFSQLLIAVSATGDPSGTWYQHAFTADPTGQYYADFPQFGFSKDKVVVTFQYRLIANDVPDSDGLVVFDKSSLYSGGTPLFGSTVLVASTYGFFLQPAHTYDTNISAIYMVQSANPNSGGHGLLKLYSVTGAATNATFTTIGTAQAAPWNGMFISDTAAQKGTSTNMNTLNDRMYQAVYRSGSIWCAHTICLPSGSPTYSAVQFWQIKTNAAVIQQGIIQDTTSKTNYAYPSIAVNRFGDAMIGCANFSASNYPSASYVTQSPLDPAGSFENPALLKAGLDSYLKRDLSSRNRWGDYSATQVDPVNDTDFWTIQEYAVAHFGALTNLSGRWALWWGNLALPNPGNDNFTNAYVISGVQGSTNGTTLRATRETGEPYHAGVTNSPSVWYKWTAPSNGSITLDISANVSTMILAVYTGSAVGSLTLVTNSVGLTPRTTFTATSNTTYRIAVAGNGGTPGTFTLDWVQPSAPMFLVVPQTTNVIVGETLQLVSLAIGTPNPAYQWRREGNAVTYGTNATLTVTNIQFADGTNYTVVATNISGAITSPVASVIIWPNSSARLLSAQLLTNGFTFTVAGLTNRPYRIESTTNLSSPSVWVSVFTNFVTYAFTNFAITNDTKRFYRAITN